METMSQLTLVADNIQITNAKISEAIESKNPGPITEMVTSCLKAGADALDINTGPLSKNPEEKMSFIVEAVRERTDAPILLDTSNQKAIEAGLKSAKGPVIINGFSLEPAKITSILPLAAKYGAAIIGYLLYPNGQVPPTADERLRVAVDLYQAFQNTGLPDELLIIDPIIAPVIWQDGIAQDFEILSVLKNLPDLLGFPVKTIAGLSNLTTGKGPKEKKRLLEMAYLGMLAGSGLTMVLLNVFHKETMNVAEACRIITQPGAFTWEQMTF